MDYRRKIWITREGWSFLSILAFIILGSIMRQINLLVLLSGLMIAPFFFNWRIAVKMVERIRFRRQLPQWVHAQVPFSVHWELTNERQRVPSWDLKLLEEIAAAGDDRSRVEKGELIVSQIEPRKSVTASYRCLLSQRGIYTFGPAQLQSAFPLGLVRAKRSNSTRQTLTVAPRLGHLTQHWNQLIRSSAVGIRSALRRRGLSDDEFYALRPWRSGDSRRSIHWRSSAKHGDLLVKQYDQRTDRDFGIALDLWSDGQVDSSVIEQSVSFFATVVSSIEQHVRGNVITGVFGDQSKILRDRMTRVVLADVMDHLAVVQAAAETGIREGLDELSRFVSHDTPLIVISTRGVQNRLLPQPGRMVAAARIARWIDMSSPEGQQHFSLEEDFDPSLLFETTTLKKVVHT